MGWNLDATVLNRFGRSKPKPFPFEIEFPKKRVGKYMLLGRVSEDLLTAEKARAHVSILAGPQWLRALAATRRDHLPAPGVGDRVASLDPADELAQVRLRTGQIDGDHLGLLTM